MPALNVVMLVGHLTRAPEVRYSLNGTPVATLGLAVNTRVKGQDGQWREEPCVIDVVVFGHQAEACGEYLETGAPALVEGRLQYRTWQDQEGHTRRTHEVIAARVQFLPRPGPRADADDHGVPASVNGASVEQAAYEAVRLERYVARALVEGLPREEGDDDRPC